ncbi:hypothetical protein IWZ03DRAFT_212000 [Phyllosticta citriasiana]|uniref:Uncharacterized protein n=1 Tax=Phyllosticta citriasiana TaxID=595635 RepID=A0ABR1KJA1_9PEZI
MPCRAVHHENRPPNQPKQNVPTHPFPSTYHYRRKHALLPLPTHHPSDPPACLASLCCPLGIPPTYPPTHSAGRSQTKKPTCLLRHHGQPSLSSFLFSPSLSLLFPPLPPRHHIASCIAPRASCRVVSSAVFVSAVPACLPISFLSFAVAHFVSIRFDSLFAQPFFLSFFFSPVLTPLVLSHRFVRARWVGR